MGFYKKRISPVFPMRRSDFSSTLLPFRKSLMSRSDSVFLSQKYSGLILPITVKGFSVFFMFKYLAVKIRKI